MTQKLCKLTLLLTLFMMSSIFAQTKSQHSKHKDNAVAKAADTGCTGQDTFDQGVRIVPNANSWKDSYQANGYCFCNSSFDHGVGNFKITINGQGRNIRDICDELKKHPAFRGMRNGDPRYNTIQCGNDPGHDDAITIQGKRIKDEKVCPGRVDLGSQGCQCKGPKFDMNWLASRPRFGGGGNNDGPTVSFATPQNNATFTNPASIKVVVNATDTDGISNVKLFINNALVRQENVAPYEWNQNNQDQPLQNLNAGNYTLKTEATDTKGKVTTKTLSFTVGQGGGNNGDGTIKGQSINKYVSSEGGSRSMRANRNTAGATEKFVFESLGGNVYAIKGNNGKYVSSENGNKAMNCNRNAVGSWERFTLESQGGNVYAIKGNNGKYVSHENGRDMGMFCNRNAVGSWEKFVITGLSAARTSANNKVLPAQQVSVYPNPATKENLRLQIQAVSDAKSFIEIMDLNGKLIAKKDLGVLKKGTTAIDMNQVRDKIDQAGLYLVKVTVGDKTTVKQMMIK